jgi:hypothetical protein
MTTPRPIPISRSTKEFLLQVRRTALLNDNQQVLRIAIRTVIQYLEQRREAKLEPKPVQEPGPV